MSISQISETLFILAIPFFLKRYGIKMVMLFSMLAWVLRFGFFAYGDPHEGLWMIIASCIVYGMAFDFFNISGALFVEKNTDSKIQSSAQGLFMLMTNGVGAVIGNIVAGVVIARWFESKQVIDGVEMLVKNWPGIWFTFAAYAMVVAILFVILFKYKHVREDVADFRH